MKILRFTFLPLLMIVAFESGIFTDNPCFEIKAECVEYIRESAEKGNVKAQYNLGLMYYSGKGIAEDKREALRWFRKAVERQHAAAQYNLGVMYENGEGVAEDKREALRWYRKAAEQGYARARYNLGVMYYEEGIANDRKRAWYLFLLAAEQGLAVAQYNLGLMYYQGEGVAGESTRKILRYLLNKNKYRYKTENEPNNMPPPFPEDFFEEDKREAYIWLLIAKASENEDAGEALQEISWQEFLPPKEIEFAKQEAKQRFEEIQKRNKTKG